MNTKRQHIMLIIGSDTLTQDALHKVLDNLNTKYGGCTLTQAKGCWSQEGDQTLSAYGNVAFETAYQIDLCVMPADFDLGYIQSALAPAKEFATWIHCEVWETQGLHFKI